MENSCSVSSMKNISLSNPITASSYIPGGMHGVQKVLCCAFLFYPTLNHSNHHLLDVHPDKHTPEPRKEHIFFFLSHI